MMRLKEISLSSLNITNGNFILPAQEHEEEATNQSENISILKSIKENLEQGNVISNTNNNINGNNNSNNNNNKRNYPELFSVQNSSFISEAEVTFSSADAFLVQNNKINTGGGLLLGGLSNVNIASSNSDYLDLVNGKSLISINLNELKPNFDESEIPQLKEKNKCQNTSTSIQYNNFNLGDILTSSLIVDENENEDNSEVFPEDLHFQLNSPTSSLNQSANYGFTLRDPTSATVKGAMKVEVQFGDGDDTDDDDNNEHTTRPPAKTLFPLSPIDSIVYFAENTCETAFQEGNNIFKINDFGIEEDNDEVLKLDKTKDKSIDSRNRLSPKRHKRLFSAHRVYEALNDEGDGDSDAQNRKIIRKRDILKLLFPMIFGTEGDKKERRTAILK